MVVNQKGRIVYATSALGSMLGLPARQLATMDLQSMVPPPYAQLHTGFLKVCTCTCLCSHNPLCCRSGRTQTQILLC